MRTDRRGQVLASLGPGTSWLYRPDGTGMLVGDADGLVLVRNDGQVVRRLAVPRENCAPVRWWEPDVALAACTGPEGRYHSQLWLVPVAGGAPTALTAVTPDPEVNDFGITDARAVGGRTVVQWRGDCGAFSVMTLGAGGATSPLPVDGPGESVLVGAAGDRLAVRGREACDGPGLWFGLVDLQGRRQVLIESAAGERRIRGIAESGGVQGRS